MSRRIQFAGDTIGAGCDKLTGFYNDCPIRAALARSGILDSQIYGLLQKLFVHLQTQGVVRVDAVHKRQAPVLISQLIDFS